MSVEWWLQLAVLALLGATLFHAVRLERALGAMRRDRTQLEALLAGLDSSTQEAQAGLDRLRGVVDGAGREAARQAGLAGALRDDLGFLVDRGERLALRLDELVRAGRNLDAPVPAPSTRPAWPAAPKPEVPSMPQTSTPPADHAGAAPAKPDAAADARHALRSQAERDLLLALRGAA